MNLATNIHRCVKIAEKVFKVRGQCQGHNVPVHCGAKKLNHFIFAITCQNFFTFTFTYRVSHMTVHHLLLHHLHYHYLHPLLLIQSFILNLRFGFSTNHFLHRPFSFLYRTDILRTLGPFNVFIMLNGWICLRGVPAQSRFSNALNIIALSFIYLFIHSFILQ